MKLSLVVLALALAVPAAAASPPSAAPAPTLPWWTQRACPVEDGVNCFWDAGATGNGAGHSFIVRRFPDGPTCVMHAERRYAREHDRCFTDR
jgi:hypothetical protein